MEKDGELWDTWLEKYTSRLRLEEEGVSDVKTLGEERITTMNSNNPRFVPVPEVLKQCKVHLFLAVLNDLITLKGSYLIMCVPQFVKENYSSSVE